MRAPSFSSSRAASSSATGERVLLLSFPDVYVSIERPHFEIGSAAVDRTVNGVVHFNPPAPTAIDVDVRIRILIRRVATNLLQIEVGVDIALIASQPQVRLEGRRQRDVYGSIQ